MAPQGDLCVDVHPRSPQGGSRLYRRFLLGVAVASVVGLLLVARVARQGTATALPQARELSDGTTLTLQCVTYGTQHPAPVYYRRTVLDRLRGRCPKLLGASGKIAPTAAGGSTVVVTAKVVSRAGGGSLVGIGTKPNSLVLWFTRSEKAAGRHLNVGALRGEARDQHGCVVAKAENLGLKPGTCAGSRPFSYLILSPFPQRLAPFRLRVWSAGRKPDEAPSAEFVVR